MRVWLEQAKGRRSWPYFLLGATLIGAGTLAFLFFRYLLPLFPNLSGRSTGENVLPIPSSVVKIGDDTEKAREVLLDTFGRHVGNPVLLGDQIYFFRGVSNSGNPSLRELMRHIPGAAAPVVEEAGKAIRKQHDNILSFDINADYVVYLDAKNTGGGSLCLLDRKTQEAWEIKKVSYGWPEPKLARGCVVWTERTGTNEDRLYLYEIATGELSTLSVFLDSPFGLSHPGTTQNEVVWAGPDPTHPDDDRFGALYFLNPSQEGASVGTYIPGMYVHRPVTNGRVRAWSDSNQGEGAGLYISMDGIQPRRIAQGIENYGLGENFVAYTKGGGIFLYWFQDNSTSRVSKVGEYASLAAVGLHGVAWFDITDERRERDILKYAVLD